MPISIRHRDKMSDYPQLPDRPLVETEAAFMSQVSYMAIATVFVVSMRISIKNVGHNLPVDTE